MLRTAWFSLLVPFSAWAAHSCLPCHQKQVTGFAQTGMGRSASTQISLPDGQVRNGMAAVRNVHEQTILSASSEKFPLAYAIGSGNEGVSLLVNVNSFLFQAPVSWYSKRKQWDLSPGFEHDTTLTFDRGVGSDCLFCHTGKASPVPGTLNRYREPVLAEVAIGCERCHGSSESHLKMPQRGNIVNPVKLDVTRRDSVCEQCHLGGEARILNPGKRFEDYQPGMRLEEVFSTYVVKQKTDALHVVGHAEGLAQSACAIKSQGKLWCGSCHDAHQQPVNAKQWHRQKCIECHAESSLTRHPADKDDCAACHMPRKKSYDGSHTAFTDHRIQRSQRPGTKEDAQELVEWRPADASFHDRNLGLAYVSAGEKHVSAQALNEGLRLLFKAREHHSRDAALNSAIGAVLMRKNAAAAAARFFRAAIEAEPGRGANHLNLAAALMGAGQKGEARRSVEEALKLDPGIEEAYRLLVMIDPSSKDEASRRFSAALPGRKLILP